MSYKNKYMLINNIPVGLIIGETEKALILQLNHLGMDKRDLTVNAVLIDKELAKEEWITFENIEDKYFFFRNNSYISHPRQLLRKIFS